MLDARKVAEDVDRYQALLSKRPNFDSALLDGVRKLSAERLQVIQDKQTTQQQINSQKAEMGKIFKTGTDEEKAQARESQTVLKKKVKDLEKREAEIQELLSQQMLSIPNVLHESVPEGKDETANQFVREWGARPKFDFEPKDHVDLGEAMGLFDFPRATKIAGARFVVQYGALAKLERALAAFMLDTHVEAHGYQEIAVPFLVNSESLLGTGQLPKFEDDQFKVPYNEKRDYWLIPTAEVPVTNLYNDEVLDVEAQPLPRTFCCHSACFRKEAGSAGRDTRGLIRLHQFNKVELVRFVEPQKSYEELEALVGHAEAILQKLGLHYRVMLLCSGDISANAAKCYDLEVWLPGQNNYREISSCSNFEDFQARRAKIRFKDGKKNKLVHTLNGSGLAVGRTLVAILENYQQEDGSVLIPEALRPYMGGQERIPKA